MKYSVLFFDECARCKQFEPDHEHKNCSFDIDHKDNITIQTFECTRCHFIWKKEIDHEDSIDNRSTLRRQAG
jgi:C4-type Zn-finger protein